MSPVPLIVLVMHLDIPPYAWVILVLVTLLYVPVALFTDYALRNVYTTLAVVENPTPASYEAVSSDDVDAVPPAPAASTADGEADEAAGMAAAPTQPITASLRRTYRLLVASSGWRGNFRGLRVALLLWVARSVVGGIIGAIPFVPAFLFQLLVSLALVQLSTAWVHVVLRTASSTSTRPSLRESLPPFRRTLTATGGPVALAWLADTILAQVWRGLAGLLRLDEIVMHPAAGGKEHGVGAFVWRAVLVGLVWIVLAFVLVLPAYVVLVRVQASLLPPDATTIVPVDRSFSGTVEPTVVGGRGYVTMRDALRTFSAPSCKRLVVLYVKAMLLSVAAHVAYLAVVVPLVFFSRRAAADPSA